MSLDLYFTRIINTETTEEFLDETHSITLEKIFCQPAGWFLTDLTEKIGFYLDSEITNHNSYSFRPDSLEDILELIKNMKPNVKEDYKFDEDTKNYMIECFEKEIEFRNKNTELHYFYEFSVWF